MKQRRTKTATIWTLSPGKRVATVSAELEDDRWIVYCGNVRISGEMRHRHNADKLAHETAYFEETGRNYDYDHQEGIPMRTPEEILNTLSAERQKLLDDVLKKIEAAQEARFQGEPIKVPLSLDRSEYASIQVKLTDALKLKRWQILKVEPFESRNDTVITLTIGAIPPPSAESYYSK